MKENMPSSKRIGWTDTHKLEDREDKKTKIRNALIAYHMGMSEFGNPEHIITREEAIKILNHKGKNINSLLHDAYGSNSLNEVLEGMGLPYDKKRQKRSEW